MFYSKSSHHHPVENWPLQWPFMIAIILQSPPRMSRCSSQYIKIIKINFVSFDVTRWQSMVQLVLIARSILMLNWEQCWGLCRLYLAPYYQLMTRPGPRPVTAHSPPSRRDVRTYRAAAARHPGPRRPSLRRLWLLRLRQSGLRSQGAGGKST